MVGGGGQVWKVTKGDEQEEVKQMTKDKILGFLKNDFEANK